MLKNTHSVHTESFRFVRSQPCGREHFFGLYLIQKGRGTIRVDYSEHEFTAPTLLCLNPYQKLSFIPRSPVSGHALHFHANFFCIETHHHAVGCNGVLFNDVYGSPLIKLSAAACHQFAGLFMAIQNESTAGQIASSELILSYLKILLIRATRLKLSQQGTLANPAPPRPEVLRRLFELIEQHYQGEHRPAAYARMLHLSPKTLGHLVKRHCRKTLTELIRDRVLKHAKWQLLHTRRPVKQIACEVGFQDELYFSRLFKRACGCAPIHYRDFETKIRDGRNLSMDSGKASIQNTFAPA